MKRTALSRKTPLARKTRMPARRATPRRRAADVIANPHYLAWLREQPCGVAVIFRDRAGECGGPIDPEHKREGVGMGQRASDMDAWACCRVHHDQRHDGRGVFATMDRVELRTFIRLQIKMYLTAYTAHLASLPRQFPADSTNPPGVSATSSAASAAGHLSPIAVGSPVFLGSREGAVSQVAGADVVVAWLDGTTTVEPIALFTTAAR